MLTSLLLDYNQTESHSKTIGMCFNTVQHFVANWNVYVEMQHISPIP